MRAKKDTSSKEKSSTTCRRYCHPLSLQSLPPERFSVTVNDILNGRLELLIDRVRHHQEST